MTDTNGGIPRQPTGIPKVPEPPALFTGPPCVIPYFPFITEPQERMPPDWFPMHSNFHTWYTQWEDALHG